MTAPSTVTGHDRRQQTDLTVAQFAGLLLLVMAVALALRGLFPLADPPTHASVGVVWHDEGAWTHNARNRVLFGTWSLDAWNPMYLAPVFTALEYASFSLFGVGLWQARLVSEAAGLLSVLLLALAMKRVAGPTAGLAAGALMAVNYVWVMWNRAALMETTMVAFMVASFYAAVRADQASRRGIALWGLAAGALAMLAFFTKAAAAFYLAALGLAAVSSLALGAFAMRRGGRAEGGAAMTLGWALAAGLAVAALIAAVLFVIPYWTEFRFYNWEMSVTRKPVYTVKALLDRASWFPIIHDFFTRMWAVEVLAAGAAMGVLVRWRHASPAERLLLFWVGLGSLELLVHDVGNERRLVFLIPALIGLTALALGRDRRLLDPSIAAIRRSRLLVLSPLLLFFLYMLIGPITRLVAIYEPRPGVRLTAAAAVVAYAAIVATWPRPAVWLSRTRWSLGATLLLLAVMVGGDLAQYVQWTLHRTYLNYDAMVNVGRWLPAGTLVHGKLANGLDFESRIRPVFVGRGFGNYADRTTRDDVRYVLTYLKPFLGYEGPVIRDVLDAYQWRVLRTFPVAETSSGADEAALIEKIAPKDR